LLVCFPWVAVCGGPERRGPIPKVFLRHAPQGPPTVKVTVGGFTIEGETSADRNPFTIALRKKLQPHPLLVLRTPNQASQRGAHTHDWAREEEACLTTAALILVAGIRVERASEATADRGLRCNVHRANGTVERFHVMNNAVEQEEGVQGAHSRQ